MAIFRHLHQSIFCSTLKPMPITKSAKKALRQSKTRQVLNSTRKRRYREAVKQFRAAIADKNFDAAKLLLPKVYKSLDKAAKRNTIKGNKADRLKSRATKALAKAQSK